MSGIKKIGAAFYLLSISLSLHAQEVEWTGFASLNYQISDETLKYRRHVDRSGTFMAGSVLGLQADVHWSDDLNSTFQTTFRPKTSDDQGYQLSVGWAALNYTPSDDWTLSAGRMRSGIYLDSQNLQVGATYLSNSLAPEVYFDETLISYDGFRVERRIELADGSLWSVELLSGQNKDRALRVFSESQGRVLFPRVDIDLSTLRTEWLTLSGIRLFASASAGKVTTSRSVFRAGLYTAGAVLPFGDGNELRAELVYYEPRRVGGEASLRWTGQLSKRIGKWTPYGALNGLSSQGEQRQTSLQLGTAWDWDLETRLKAEVLQVNTGDRSTMIDGNLPNQSFTVLGFSINRLF